MLLGCANALNRPPGVSGLEPEANRGDGVWGWAEGPMALPRLYPSKPRRPYVHT